MDKKSEKFQAMGIFDIYREAYKVTVSWKKIFSQISLALILPLAFIFLAHIEISELVLNKILSNLKPLEDPQVGNPNYNKILSLFFSELIIFTVLDTIFMLFLFAFSLLSTSAIVYTVACVYSSKEINFKKVTSVVPTLWKRLMITFLWNLLIVFLYNLIMVLVIILLAVLYLVLSETLSVHINSTVAIFVVLLIIFIPFLIGVMYISLVWFLASVITILEDIRGIKAIKKGRNLIKGKIWISWRIYATFISCSAAIQFVFRNYVVHGDSLAMVGRVSLGICCLLLLVILIHFGLVSQTIVYFVCKSYHKENIDQSNIADHLDGYDLGYYYAPLRKDEDLQIAGNSV